MSRIAISRPVTTSHKPCGLPYHDKGRRVKWQSWDAEAKRFQWNRGTVLVHAARQLVIATDGGGQTRTSCGHVVGVK